MKKVIYHLCISVIFSVQLFAQQINSDSLQQIISTGADADKLVALQIIAQLNRNNNPQLAIQYLNQAIQYATELKDDASHAKALQTLAAIEFRMGITTAKEHYTEALGYYVNLKNTKNIADVTAALAGIYFSQGNLPLSSENYLKALRYYEELKDKVGMVNVFNALGSIYARQNNFSKSIEYNLKAISLYEESSDKFRALVGYDNIGNSYLRQQEPQKAKTYFLKSLALYTEFNNNPGIASTLYQLGTIEQLDGHSEKAINYFKRSLFMSEQIKALPIMVSNYNAMGATFVSIRLYDKAIQSYQKAIQLSKNIDSKIELEEAYQGLAIVYKLTQENEKATTFSTLSKELKDSIFNDSSLKKLTDQLLVYESEKKQQQIELLHKEQQINEIELTKEKAVTNLFTIASIVLGVLFIFLIAFTIQNRRIAKNLRKQQIELIDKNASIMEQKEKLDQLNSVKDRFFSIISHDLRNNLTTMKLYFDLVSNKEYVPIDTSEITKQISSSVENTIDLLENLLIWASAQIKGVTIHRQKLNIHSLSQENINLLNSAAHQKNISLVNSVDENITAFADIDMINLVLRNLISNAIKFTPESGSISLLASITEQKCIVEIKDNGVGISTENLAKLFNQHEHPSTKGTANEKGTGLGLMLCKDFIERNGGTIWAESQKDNGTSFFFSLPLQS